MDGAMQVAVLVAGAGGAFIYAIYQYDSNRRITDALRQAIEWDSQSMEIHRVRTVLPGVMGKLLEAAEAFRSQAAAQVHDPR